MSEPQMSEQQEQQNLNEFAKMLADGKITPEQACSLIEELRDADPCLEEIDAQNEQQKCFNEIAWVFADWKITTEEACDLFKEWLDEWIVAGKAE
jgi:threonine dehydrogenase-like Zn-dependent dehydrogenase